MKVAVSPQSSPIRVGIIGFGNAGRLIHAPLLRHTPGFDLVAVSSSRPDAVRAELQDVAVHPDPGSMLARPDIDLIVVATPPDSHVKWAEAAVASSKHVLVEKPFTVTLAEAATVLERGRAAGRMVTVFQNRRFDSCFRSVRAAIESGAVGRINHFESQYNRFNTAIIDTWRAPAAPGSGLWYDTGVHVIDQAIQLFGLPDAISMTAAINRSGSDAVDWCHAVLLYPTMRAVLHCSMLVAGGVPRFTVHGDAASLIKQTSDSQGRQLWSGMSPDDPRYGQDDDVAQLVEPDGSRTPQPLSVGDYRSFFSELGAAIRGEGQNPTSASDVLGVMAVLEAGVQSAREGRVVPIALPALGA